MEGLSTEIQLGKIENNVFFKGAPVTRFHVDDLGWDITYLIIKPKDHAWPMDGGKISAILFDGIVDCGVPQYNGIIFIK